MDVPLCITFKSWDIDHLKTCVLVLWIYGREKQTGRSFNIYFQSESKKTIYILQILLVSRSRVVLPWERVVTSG